MSKRKLIISSYLIEIVLSLLVILLIKLLNIDLSPFLQNILQNIGEVISFYAVIAGISLTLLGFVVCESDADFIKWLVSKRAEKVYRDASFYSLITIVISLILLFLFKRFSGSLLIEKCWLFSVLYSVCVFFTQIKMAYNYFELKRLYQGKY